MMVNDTGVLAKDSFDAGAKFLAFLVPLAIASYAIDISVSQIYTALAKI